MEAVFQEAIVNECLSIGVQNAINQKQMQDEVMINAFKFDWNSAKFADVYEM